MKTSRRRRLRSSQASARFVVGAVLGELLGGLVGVVGARWQHTATSIGTTTPRYGYASKTSDTSNDPELADPFVAWPVVCAVAGFVVGIGTVRLYEAVRRVPKGA